MIDDLVVSTTTMTMSPSTPAAPHGPLISHPLTNNEEQHPSGINKGNDNDNNSNDNKKKCNNDDNFHLR